MNGKTLIRVIWHLSKGTSKFLLLVSVTVYIVALETRNLAVMQGVAVLTTYSILAFYYARKEIVNEKNRIKEMIE